MGGRGMKSLRGQFSDTPAFRALREKTAQAMVALHEAFIAGKVHGCGRAYCCLEFEMEKGDRSDFYIRKKLGAVLLPKGKKGRKGCQ